MDAEEMKDPASQFVRDAIREIVELQLRKGSPAQ